jgi:hypothetical protein
LGSFVRLRIHAQGRRHSSWVRFFKFANPALFSGRTAIGFVFSAGSFLAVGGCAITQVRDGARFFEIRSLVRESTPGAPLLELGSFFQIRESPSLFRANRSLGSFFQPSSFSSLGCAIAVTATARGSLKFEYSPLDLGEAISLRQTVLSGHGLPAARNGRAPSVSCRIGARTSAHRASCEPSASLSPSEQSRLVCRNASWIRLARTAVGAYAMHRKLTPASMPETAARNTL